MLKIKTKNKKKLQIVSDILFYLDCSFVGSLVKKTKNIKITDHDVFCLYYKKTDSIKFAKDYGILNNACNEQGGAVFNVDWENIENPNDKLHNKIIILKVN